MGRGRYAICLIRSLWERYWQSFQWNAGSCFSSFGQYIINHVGTEVCEGEILLQSSQVLDCGGETVFVWHLNSWHCAFTPTGKVTHPDFFFFFLSFFFWTSRSSDRIGHRDQLLRARSLSHTHRHTLTHARAHALRTPRPLWPHRPNHLSPPPAAQSAALRAPRRAALLNPPPADQTLLHSWGRLFNHPLVNLSFLAHLKKTLGETPGRCYFLGFFITVLFCFVLLHLNDFFTFQRLRPHRTDVSVFYFQNRRSGSLIFSFYRSYCYF